MKFAGNSRESEWYFFLSVGDEGLKQHAVDHNTKEKNSFVLVL